MYAVLGLLTTAKLNQKPEVSFVCFKQIWWATKYRDFSAEQKSLKIIIIFLKL